MIKEKHIDIVIVNWNSGKFLSKCITSLIDNDSALINKIIIVDNASSDKSADFLKDINFNKIKYIKLNSNEGFARGCNIGAASSQSKYILFLNPDAQINNGSIELTHSFMEMDTSSDIGICGVRLQNDINFDYSCSRFPSLKNLFFEILGIAKLFPKYGRLMKDFDHKKSMKVDQVIGAFFLTRASLFARLKGFDERFFVYYEEVDFSLRAKKIGFSSFFLANANAYHYGGGASKNVMAKRTFYNLRSRVLYFKKNSSKLIYFFAMLLILFIEPITRNIFFILKLSMNDIRENIKAYVLFFNWIIKEHLK